MITKPEPYCPNCGAKMVLHKSKITGRWFDPFWGCSQYPDCKGTRDIDDDGRPIYDEVEYDNS